MEQEQQDEKLRLHQAKSKAVSEAMAEVVREHQDEIIRRARAKLTAQGVPLNDEEAGAQL